jgi:hypothetical protein
MGNLSRSFPHVNSAPCPARYRITVAGNPSDPGDGYLVTDDDGMPVVWFPHFSEARAAADRFNLDPLAEPEVDEVDDADRAWLARQNGDWHEPGPMCCGYSQFDDTTDYEAEIVEVERYFRPRARSMRLDAEEEARMYGWAR